MVVEVEVENGFFPPIASNSCILHAIVESKEEEEELAPFWYSPLPQSTYAKHIEKTTVSRTNERQAGTHLPTHSPKLPWIEITADFGKLKYIWKAEYVETLPNVASS